MGKQTVSWKSTLSRDFAAFRDSGSATALAQVFDATAPRLLLLAGHLTRDPGEAEDLVQTTFLQVMDDGRNFRGELTDSAVFRWLSRILRNRAVDLHRGRRFRASTLESEPTSLEQEPLQRALNRDLYEQVLSAIEELPESYRPVLVLFVVHGLKPTPIAHALGRSPGTVRTQLQRGLEALRGRLPQMASLIALPSIGMNAMGRGLPAVRARVVAEANSFVVGSASVLSAGTFGTLSAMKITQLVLGSALVVTLAGLLIRQQLNSRQVSPAPSQSLTKVDPLPAEYQPETRPLQESARSTAPGTSPVKVEAASTTLEHSSDLFVRVLQESTSEPLEGVNVYLRGMSTFREQQPGVSAVTKADGLAHFKQSSVTQADHLAVHIARSERSFQLHPQSLGKERTFEVRITQGSDIEGKVLDLAGQGVAQASVYAWNEEHHEYVHFVAKTDEQGSFVLKGWSRFGKLLARHPDFQSSELTWYNERGVELTLGARGVALTGRVIDSKGHPSPHAWIALAHDEDARELLGGSQRRPDPSKRGGLDCETLLLRADSEGHFNTSQVPAGYALLLARSASEDSPEVCATSHWLTGTESHEVTLKLEPAASIRGCLVDENGRACANLPIAAEWQGTPELGQLEDDWGELFALRSCLSDERGNFELSGLFGGTHQIEVLTSHGPDDELFKDKLDLIAGQDSLWNPVLPPIGRLLLRLLDAQGAPLVGWSVEVDGGDRWSGLRASEQVTDAEGCLELQGLLQDPADLAFFAPFPSPLVRRQLPTARRPEFPLGELEQVVHLKACELPKASASGQVLLPSGGPLANKGLRLSFSSGTWDHYSQIVTDETGHFAIGNLPCGAYRLDLGEDFGLSDFDFVVSIAGRLDLGVIRP